MSSIEQEDMSRNSELVLEHVEKQLAFIQEKLSHYFYMQLEKGNRKALFEAIDTLGTHIVGACIMQDNDHDTLYRIVVAGASEEIAPLGLKDFNDILINKFGYKKCPECQWVIRRKNCCERCNDVGEDLDDEELEDWEIEEWNLEQEERIEEYELKKRFPGDFGLGD